jgi:hypothetical protein
LLFYYILVVALELPQAHCGLARFAPERARP